MATGDPVMTLGKAVTLRRDTAQLHREDWLVEGDIRGFRYFMAQDSTKFMVVLQRVESNAYTGIELPLVIFASPRRLGPNHIIATYIGEINQ